MRVSRYDPWFTWLCALVPALALMNVVLALSGVTAAWEYAVANAALLGFSAGAVCMTVRAERKRGAQW